MRHEESIFAEALQKPSPEERRRYITEACAGDAALQQQVEALLAAHERTTGLLDAPLLDATPSGATDEPIHAAQQATPEPAHPRVGRYRLLEQIGEGGMGAVFMAEQTHPVRRHVALKIIKPGLDTSQVIARFEAERQALALMDHPNIARVLDAGATDAGRPYFVMELVKGIPITDYCDQHQLPPRQRLELFVQVCQAVQHAHTKGIIHRDIKPSNVLVTVADDGRAVPKVIDFGIAKATAGQRLTDRTLFTEFRQLLGTPLYMSPEQAELNVLQDVDTRSDVYSLGVLLYELLTGTTPFDKQRLARAAYDEVRRIIREEEPPRPSTRLSTMGDALTTVSASRHTDPRRLSQLVRGELDWIVMRAMEKDRTRRYETANGLARDVERYLSDEPVVACPPSRTYRLRKFARRNKPVIATAGLIAAVLIVATAVSTSQAVRARRAQREVTVQRDHVLVEKRRADGAAAQAQHRLADSMVTEARLLLNADRVGEAKVRLAHATETYRSINRNPVAADLTFLDAVAVSPQPLHRIQTKSPRANVAILPDCRAAIIRRFTLDQRPGVAECVDLRTGAVLQRFVHDHGILGFDVSRDGRLLLTGGATAPFDVTLWNVSDARIIQTFKGHTGVVKWVVICDDGRRAVTCGLDRKVRAWEVGSGRLIFSRETDAAPIGMDASPDGRLVAVAMRGRAELWEIESATLRQEPPSHGGNYVEFSADGRTIDCGGPLWDVDRSERVPRGSENQLIRLGWSLPGYRGASLMRSFGAGGELAAGKNQRVYFEDGARRDINQLAVSDDERFVATASSPGEIVHWPLKVSGDTRRVLHGGGPSHRETGIVLTPDGRAAIATDRDRRKLLVWDLATGSLLHAIGDGKEPAGPCALAVSPDGKYLLASSPAGDLRLWEVTTARLVRAWQAHAEDIAVVAFSPDGRRAVSCGTGPDGLPKIWDVETGRLLSTYGGHRRARSDTADVLVVRGALFTPDGSSVVSTASDGTLHVWDAVTGEQRRVLPGHVNGPIDQRGVFCLRLAGSDRLLSGSKDRTVRLWDLHSGQEIRRFQGHTGWVWAAAESPDQKLIASASADQTLRVWDADSGEQLFSSQVGDAVREVRFSADGRYLVSSAGRQITIRDLTRPARYREFERLLPQAREKLQSGSNDPASLKLLGEWYAFRGVWDWGAEFLEKARANGADVSSLELARCHWLSGNREAAQREFRAAVERNEAPRPYLELCLAGAAAGGALPTDPQVRDERWVWQHAIDARAWEQNPAEVLEVARRFAEQKPEDSSAVQVLGWALYRAGDYRGSIEALEKSIALQDQPSGGDPWQWFFLAMAHSRLGEPELARAWYRASLQWLAENPQSDDADAKMMRDEAANVLGLPDRWPWQPVEADRRIYQRLLHLRKDADWAGRQLAWVERSLDSADTEPGSGPTTHPNATTAPAPSPRPR